MLMSGPTFIAQEATFSLTTVENIPLPSGAVGLLEQRCAIYDRYAEQLGGAAPVPGALMLGGWQTGSKHLAGLLRAAYPGTLKELGGSWNRALFDTLGPSTERRHRDGTTRAFFVVPEQPPRQPHRDAHQPAVRAGQCYSIMPQCAVP